MQIYYGHILHSKSDIVYIKSRYTNPNKTVLLHEESHVHKIHSYQMLILKSLFVFVIT